MQNEERYKYKKKKYSTISSHVKNESLGAAEGFKFS